MLLKFLIASIGGLEDILEVLKPKEQHFKSIDEILKSKKKSIRKRGGRK